MIQVQGIKEIRDVLNSWPADVQHKVLQNVHAEAAIPLVNAAHFLAPVGRTGNLADSIGVEKPSVRSALEVGEVRVGARRSSRYRGFHAHLVEYGTTSRTRRNGGSTGVMPKKPFMKPAFEQTKGDLFRKIDLILGDKLTKTMRRKLKSGGGSWLKV